MTPASGGRSSRAGKGRLRFGLSGVACWFPARGWRSGLTSTHPAPRQCAGGCHDHMSGTGLLSHVIERGAGAAHAARASSPGAWRPSRSHGRRGGCSAWRPACSASRCQARVSSLREIAMVAIFFPRRLAMAGVGGGEVRGPLGGLRGLVHHPPQPRRALPGDVPVPDFEVRAPHRRGQPGPAGQLAGAAEPGDVADLGHHDQRGELPDPGQRPEHLDPGSPWRAGAARRRSGRSPAPGRRSPPGSR